MLQLKPKKNLFFRARNFNNNYEFAYSSSASTGIELRDIQMPEAANSEEIYLEIGPWNLWNVRPKTTQKGLYKIYLKYKKIKNNMHFAYFHELAF
jgi:hypothetical protein